MQEFTCKLHRRMAAHLCLCVLSFCVLFLSVPANAYGAEALDEATGAVFDEPIAMEVEYGYGNTAKGGRYLPVDVTVRNKQDGSIKGTLQIKTTESDGTIYRYDYPVIIEAQGMFQDKYYIPVGTVADQLFLSLVDEQENVLINKKVRLSVSRDVPELFVGVLSDSPWELQYLNGIGVRYSTLRTRTIELVGENMPEDQIGLSLLDVLVVNNYRLRNLSEAQTAAIMDWVHSGGVLLMGTGERVDDTLGRFAPELLDDAYDSPNLRHINLGEGVLLEQPEEGMLAISCVNVPLHGGNVMISSNGFPVLTVAAKEQGLIGVLAFDMEDIGAFCGKNSTYVDYMFSSLLGETRINRLSELAYSGNSGKYWSVQSLINTGDVDKLPNQGIYVCVIGIYLLLLGPGLYFFLKRYGLQIYYRRGVMTLSVVFAVIIYVIGSGTRFDDTFYVYATIQDITEDFVTDTTYVNVRNPYNKPYTVELNPEYSILPITRNDTELSGKAVDLNGENPYQVAITSGVDSITIQNQNITAFSPRYFQLERKFDNDDQVGITGEAGYFEGKISGTLTNQFPFPLENAALILYGNMVYLDRIEPGETKDLAELELLRFPLGNSYVVADRISGESTFFQTDIHNKEYLLAMERANMLKFYMDNYMTSYTADGRLLAFSTEKEENQFLKNNTGETYGLTMLTSAVEINASRNSSIYRSVLMKVPRVVGGNYDEKTNSMSGAEPLTLEYQMGTDITVESLTFENVSEEFSQISGFSEVFEGNIYFYNHGTSNFDQMELKGNTMNIEELGPYLSPGNTLTVRYVYGGTGGYNSIQLPMPMVAGRAR